ncbi:MAG: TIGR00341 family protein [Algoriphagus sp.]|jgi:uncharacterized hydrophobic protein (TIGR00271 family)|nr:TIGR00341 family protein [Algoriphagus sp.]
MENEQLPNQKRNRLVRTLVYLRNRFDLEDGKEDELETIDYISKNVEFKGANLWILIFAIFVASVGLNVNSTAVIIGAMLISPLMGPIMGIGLAAGINDFELLKKSFRNLGVAIFISILTSTLYFYISPISDAQSELLARTEPTVWDVLIALFGGLAGIVAGSRKEKSNAIPGVAIATALMPPLCTAGYGLASGNLYFFFGAFYLFFINSVFISLSTYLIVRFMKYPKKEFIDPKREKRVQTYITVVTLLTLIPSIWLAYGLVRKSYWEQQARRFVQVEFQFENTLVLSSDLKYAPERTIEVRLIGEPLSVEQQDQLEKKLGAFGLENTAIQLLQNGTGMDLSSNRNDILNELYRKNEALLADRNLKIKLLEEEISQNEAIQKLSLEVANEALVIYPNLTKFSLGRSIFSDLKKQEVDTLLAAFASFEPKPSLDEERKFRDWLQIRTKADTLALILD